MPNVAGPTLVAMSTKFGLGMEIQSPTSLFVGLFIMLIVISRQVQVL